MNARVILLTVALCAVPTLGGAGPRVAPSVAYATPAPEATSPPATATSAVSAPSEAAPPSTPPAGVQTTPLVAPAPSLVEAPPAGPRSAVPDITWAAARLTVAFTAVGLLLVGGLKLYRRSLQPGARSARRRSGSWLARWVPASAGDEDKIALLARNYLGTRESVCVLRVGTERFLVGVTSAQISMLARLGCDRAPLGGPATIAAADEPAPPSESLGSPAAAPRTSLFRAPAAARA